MNRLIALLCAALLWTPLALAAPLPDFDRNAAMDLAGLQVPAEVESFYFFILTEATAKVDAADLAEKLQAAAAERDYIGIIGADPELNLKTLRAALRACAGKPLKGAVVIFLGPADQREAVDGQLRGTGAELRYVTYPVAPPI